MNTEPKTVEELLSCEEREMFSYRTEVKENGDTMHIPIVEKACVTPITEDSIMFVWDDKGVAWRPTLHDGVWYRQRWPL